MQYIDAVGLTGLFKVLDMEVDHALITALVERWRLETHTFHLPHGEMGITLQDMEVMLGLSVDGLPVTERTDYVWSELFEELLGHKSPPLIPNLNKSTFAGARIKYNWLDAQFAAPLAADAGDEVMQQHARYHLLVRMGAGSHCCLCSCSTQSAMRDGIARVVQHWPGSIGNFVVHRRRMRCKLEEHSCWYSYGPIQGSHD